METQESVVDLARERVRNIIVAKNQTQKPELDPDITTSTYQALDSAEREIDAALLCTLQKHLAGDWNPFYGIGYRICVGSIGPRTDDGKLVSVGDHVLVRQLGDSLRRHPSIHYRKHVTVINEWMKLRYEDLIGLELYNNDGEPWLNGFRDEDFICLNHLHHVPRSG